jgi:hypothetical protein
MILLSPCIYMCDQAVLKRSGLVSVDGRQQQKKTADH